MKTKLILITFFLFVFTSSLVLAQNTSTVKIGYTDPEYVLSLLPRYKEIESELKSYEKQLQSQLDGKLKEYQAKLELYQKDMATMPDLIKQDKEKELIGMQGSIKEFEEGAMSSMQKKQATLLDPLIQSVQKAIDQVATENGFTYILSTAAGSNAAIILFAKNKDEDISELVLKKLGVTPPVKTESTTGTTNAVAPTNAVTPNKTTTTNTTAPVKKK